MKKVIIGLIIALLVIAVAFFIYQKFINTPEDGMVAPLNNDLEVNTPINNKTNTPINTEQSTPENEEVVLEEEEEVDLSENPSYCQSDNDCLMIPNPANSCYFGYFNKNAIEAMKEFRKSSAMMKQDCPRPTGVVCEDNKCVKSSVAINDTPAAVLSSAIQAAKEGDYDTYLSFTYYNKLDLGKYYSENYLGLSEEDYIELKNSLIEEMKSVFTNIDYQVKEQKIEGDTAILTISATKNGRKKQDIKKYFIKENNNWKINTFGWSHPADATTNDIDECSDYCTANNLMNGLFYQTDNECYCWHEQPQTENLSHLNIEECEQKEKSFQGSCYTSYARINKDENYCKKVSIMNRDSCYSDVAKIKDDISICDNMWDDAYCLSQFE